MSTAEGPGAERPQPSAPPMPHVPPQPPPAAPPAGSSGAQGFGQAGGIGWYAPVGTLPQHPAGAPPMQGGGHPASPQQFPVYTSPHMVPGGANAPGPRWPGQPAQSARPPRSRVGLGCLITFLVVVTLVAAVGGAGAWWLFGWGKGRVLWSHEYPDQADMQNYLATWTADEYIVRAHSRTVLGLASADGAEKWEVPVPGASENLICAASSVSSEGVVILAYGKIGFCTNVFAVDMKNGEILWDKPLGGDTSEQPHLAVSQGAVVVNDKMAYRMQDGSELWQSDELDSGQGCTSGVYVGGAKLVRTQGCEAEEDDFGDALSVAHATSEIDPLTGEVLWTYEAEERHVEPSDPANGHILSTSPVLVLETADQYRVLNDAGEPGGLLKIGNLMSLGQGLLSMEGSPVPALASSKGTFVIEKPGKSDATFEEVMAFDASTGEKLWSTGPSDTIRYDIVQGDHDRLLAVKYDFDTLSPDSSKRPFSLVEFDPATGEQTEVQDYEGVGLDLGHAPVPYLHGDKLIMMSTGSGGSTGQFAEDPGNGDFHDLSLVVLET